MNIKQEVEQIVNNAISAYRRGEITLQQLQEVTHIPLKDLYLTMKDKK